MKTFNTLLGLTFLFIMVTTGCRHSDENLVPVQSMCQRAKEMHGFSTVPVPCSGKDSDKDGIDDAADHCPTYPETNNNEYDLDGCPDPDADGDFIVDYQDACPQTPGLIPDGCPLLDADHDGIADHLDSCPHQREDLDGEFDQDGCPEGAQVYASTIEGIAVLRMDVFSFENGATRYSEADMERLEEASDALLGQESQIVRAQLDVYVSVHERAQKDARVALAKKRTFPIAKRLVQARIPRELIVQNYFEIDEKSKKGSRLEMVLFIKTTP